jgi:hypothetical protein
VIARGSKARIARSPIGEAHNPIALQSYHVGVPTDALIHRVYGRIDVKIFGSYGEVKRLKQASDVSNKRLVAADLNGSGHRLRKPASMLAKQTSVRTEFGGGGGV